MAARLKLLQFAQKMFQDNGIYPSQAINWRNSSVLIALIQMLLFSLAFLIVKADNIVDAGTCFYAVSTELFCSTGLLTSLYDIPKILQLIEKYEDFIEQSESTKEDSILFFFLQFWNQNLLIFRIEIFKHINKLQRVGRKYWKSVEMVLHCLCEVHTYWNNCHHIAHNIDQLLYLWFGRWIILFVISRPVSAANEKPVQVKHGN